MAAGEAVAVLNLDSWTSNEARERVKANPAIHSVTVVKLPSAGEMLPWQG